MLKQHTMTLVNSLTQLSTNSKSALHIGRHSFAITLLPTKLAYYSVIYNDRNQRSNLPGMNS